MKRVLWLVVATALVGLGAAGLIVGLRHQDDASALPTAPTALGSLLQPETAGSGPAPQLAGPAIDGSGPLDLTALRGRTVVVNFFASWCAPCKIEGPELKRFAAGHRDVVLLGVDAQDGDGQAGARFARELGFTWRSLADPDGSAMARWHVGGLPATFVVDAHGRIVIRKLGQITLPQLEQMVAAVPA
jgi:cytochrome c biogenesis protein CcmG/thiol:disulfide interchange protein DsbE